MSTSEPIEIDAAPDTEPDVSSDYKAPRKRKRSSMYDTWGFEMAAQRDATHKGAQCIACKHHAEAKRYRAMELPNRKSVIKIIKQDLVIKRPNRTSS